MSGAATAAGTPPRPQRAGVAAAAAAPVTLPSLREDLRLFVAAPGRDGSPAWMIQDPATNRFFRIGWPEFEILARWSLRDPALLVRAVRDDTPLSIHIDDVMRVAQFLRQHQLLRASDAAGVAQLAAAAAARRTAYWKWLLHNYLFIRIPLVRPQRLLAWLAPRCGLFYTRGFAACVVAAALLGLVLASRQWDAFVHAFDDFATLPGILGYAAAILFAKTLHELGHAVTASRSGVRVAHMGVAFLVLWPMPYTDTGESWKLADRHARFRIAAAGIATEFALAAFATLGWSLAPEGALRDAMYFLATTSWVLTLGINASPFMRFDGYFLLSDALDLPNLHARSFALATAALRRRLLGWSEPDPESFSPGLRRFLVAFAYLTWTYRLIVFTGIAIAVYLFFFKLLGVFLFAVEIVWFIGRPVWAEARVWWRRRAEIRGSRRLLLLAFALAAGLALLVPWRADIGAGGWVHAAAHQAIYSPFAARIESLRQAGPVKAGDVLVVLDSPDTRSRAQRSRLAADALSLQFDQAIGRVDAAERGNLIAEQLAEQLAELTAQRDELRRLRLVAPFDGEIVDHDPQIAVGTWVSANQAIATLVDPREWVVDAFVEQGDVARLRVGSAARFYRLDAPREPMRGSVVAIDSARVQVLPESMLSAGQGGMIAATRQPDGRWAPRAALYRVRVKLEARPSQMRAMPGRVRIEGEPRVLAREWLNAAAAVIVRESGF